MDQCKNCGAPVEDGQTLCADCLNAQTQENAAEPQTAPEAEMTAAAPEETPEAPNSETENEAAQPETEPAKDAEDAPAPEEPEAEAQMEPETAPEDETPEKKPVSEQTRRLRAQLGMGAMLLVAAIAVCLVVYFTQGRPGANTDTEPDITLSTPSDQPDTADTDTDAADEPVVYPSYTKDPADATDEEKYAVVATCAGEELTNQMFSYYYWYSYSSFLNSYYTYVYYYGLIDTTAPLSEQSCYFDDSKSWQEYFIENSVNAFAQFTLLSQRAEAEGFTLPEETQTELDGLYDTLKASADEGGFDSVDAYLQEYYGAFADYETYHAFMTTYYTALNYDDQIYNGFTYTDDEVSAYFDEHAEEIGVEKDDSLMVDVRHILIQPEAVEDVTDEDGNVDEEATAKATEEAMEAARAEAESIYEQWKNGEATEDSFGELAYNESMDTGSYGKGGLYEDVYPGEMIAEFNDWCFDQSRQPGDTDIVKTDYGYHIMYFVGYGETSYWRQVTKETMVQNAYDAFFSELMEDDDSTIETEKVVLFDPHGIYGSDESETDAEADADTDTDAAAE